MNGERFSEMIPGYSYLEGYDDDMMMFAAPS